MYKLYLNIHIKDSSKPSICFNEAKLCTLMVKALVRFSLIVIRIVFKHHKNIDNNENYVHEKCSNYSLKYVR